MISSRKLQKYLSRGYVQSVKCFSQKDSSLKICKHFVVIPVCDEPDIGRSISQWGKELPDNCGVLLVINHPENAALERKLRNRVFLQQLNDGENFGFPAERLFWIDAVSAGKEITGGVGEARKIGLDSALNLLQEKELSESLLISCDGDTLIAADYWKKLTRIVLLHPDCGAFCLGVHHQKGQTPEEEVAIREYECYLQSYVDGLCFAESPYAYHSIGSAIVVKADAYLLAGGMRAYSAGEDFYFLQALRKVTGVWQMTEKLVFPAARPSDRVPFGTGKAICSLLSGEKLPKYPKEAFVVLRQFLMSATDENLGDAEKFSQMQTSEVMTFFLRQNHFLRVWPRVVANTAKRPGALIQAFHSWFDALKTYRFIHFFMENMEKRDG